MIKLLNDKEWIDTKITLNGSDANTKLVVIKAGALAV